MKGRESYCLSSLKKAFIVQQGEVQSPAPEEEQPQGPVYSGGHPAGKQLGRKRPGGPSGQQGEHKPAKGPCCKEVNVPGQKGHGHTGDSLTKDHEDDEGTRAFLL